MNNTLAQTYALTRSLAQAATFLAVGLFAVYLSGIFTITSMMAGHRHLEGGMKTLQAEAAEIQQDVYTRTSEVLAGERARLARIIGGTQTFTYVTLVDSSGDNVALVQ